MMPMSGRGAPQHDRQAIRRIGMISSGPQISLDASRLAEFYHDNFVTDQVMDFGQLVAGQAYDGVVADVGGGCGFFAEALQRRYGVRVRVLDADALSISECNARGIEAELFDALSPRFKGDERVVTFNLILHHLVASNDQETRTLQTRAVAAWRGRCERVFVNEYIYTGYPLPRLSAWLIWAVTHNKALSLVAGIVGRAVPSLRANTLGVGVRFRTAEDWKRIFSEAGFAVSGHVQGANEPVGIARRLLLIRTIRRDSFLLVPRPDEGK